MDWRKYSAQEGFSENPDCSGYQVTCAAGSDRIDPVPQPFGKYSTFFLAVRVRC
jgi:hypothetical protein